MKRLLMLFVGAVGYLLFLLALFYAMAFTLDLGVSAPIGVPLATPWTAAFIDAGLLLAFGVHHSVMARRRSKQYFTRIISPRLERSIYVMTASCVLLAVFWFWQPIPSIVWQVNQLVVRAIFFGLTLLGWGIVVLSSFLINHFELFGLKQVWQTLRGKTSSQTPFRTPSLYRLARHPMMAGFFIVFWTNPSMTIDRLLFALGMSVYILIGVAFEERDLLRVFGATYENYQARVPGLIPFLRRKQTGVPISRKGTSRSAETA